MSELEDKNIENQEQQESTNKINVEDFLGDESAEFLEKNSSSIKISSIVLAILIVGWFSYSVLYKNYVVAPENEKSLAAIWKQEAAAFDNNDWNSLINGDSNQTFKGLEKVVDQYSGYDGGKLAEYDL